MYGELPQFNPNPNHFIKDIEPFLQVNRPIIEGFLTQLEQWEPNDDYVHDPWAQIKFYFCEGDVQIDLAEHDKERLMVAVRAELDADEEPVQAPHGDNQGSDLVYTAHHGERMFHIIESFRADSMGQEHLESASLKALPPASLRLQAEQQAV